jgi:hypothetical protein
MADTPFFVEPLAFSVVSTNNELSTNPALHLGEFMFGGMVWRTTSITAGNAVVTVDLGALRDIDFVAVLGANAQAGTTIRVDMDNTNTTLGGGSPTYTSGVQTFISPAVSGLDAYNSHLELGSTQTRRYVQIIIAGHTGAFEAAFLVIGKRVRPSKFYETDWEAGPDDQGLFAMNRNGVPSVADGAMLRAVGFDLEWITEAEYETAFLPMLTRLGRRNPVFLSFDPAATTYRQGRTYFGPMRDLGPPRKRGFNRFGKRFAILSKI